MRLRRTLLTVLALGCSPPNPNTIDLEIGRATRVGTCNVLAGAATDRFVTLQYRCGIADSTLDDDRWWGSGEEPLGAQLAVGDCLLIGTTDYYCVRAIERADSARLTKTYSMRNGDNRFLDKVSEN